MTKCNKIADSLEESFMKKFLLAFFTAVIALPVFAKDIPLQVTETEWGFEISNIDAKGKIICKGFLDFEWRANVFIVLKNSEDTFSYESFANEIVDGSLKNVYSNLKNVISLSRKKFSMANKDKNNKMYGPLVNYDSVLVLISKGKIEECSAYSDGKNMHINISAVRKDTDSKFAKLIKTYDDERIRKEAEKRTEEARIEAEKKAEEERLAAKQQAELKMSKLRKSKSGDFSKNESYIYTLTQSGKIKIAAYIGSSVDNLVIPETIEGLPVEEIGMGFWKYYDGEWSTRNDAESIAIIKTITCKIVTIPKTVIKIADCAFERMGIEKMIIAKGSILKSIGMRTFAENEIKEYNIPQSIVRIGNEAFYNNQIEELRIPRKELVIGNRAFDSNKIKKVSIFSDWTYKDDNERSNYNHPFITNSGFLEEVVFEDGCEDIVCECFEGCSQLRKVTIPASMKRIWARAFKNCSSLSEIVLNGKFKIDNTGYWNTYFDRESFYGCPLPIKTKSELLQAGLTTESF